MAQLGGRGFGQMGVGSTIGAWFARSGRGFPWEGVASIIGLFPGLGGRAFHAQAVGSAAMGVASARWAWLRLVGVASAPRHAGFGAVGVASVLVGVVSPTGLFPGLGGRGLVLVGVAFAPRQAGFGAVGVA